MILNILLYIMIAYMAFNIFKNSRMSRQNQSLVGVINSINEPDVFFTKAEELIETSETSLYKNKGRVLKLWGTAYHERYDSFEEVMNSIEIDELINRSKSIPSITSSEDSFFYLFLAIPNILEGKGKREYRLMLENKMSAAAEELKDQMVVQMAKACDEFYEEENDRGLSFFERILEGDYEGVIYSKNLIGLYKMICSSMCAKLYKEAGNTEKYEEMLPMTEKLAETGVGQRWLAGIDLTVEPKKEEDTAEIEEVSKGEEENE